MPRIAVRGAIVGLALLSANALVAATYVVPSDHEMVRRATSIVIGEALTSYSRINEKGVIETVTPFSISEVIKGSLDAKVVNVYEPGGVYHDRGHIIPGVPTFTEGEKVLLFLTNTGVDRWSITDLALGRFTFATDRAGRKVAVRAEGDIVGWDLNGDEHKEVRRDAGGFVRFLREEALGGDAKIDYVVPSEPLIAPEPPARHKVSVLSTYTDYSYTTDGGGSLGTHGVRWNVFPATPKAFYVEPGTTAPAITAVTTALSTWSSAAGASVNYTYGGIDPCVPSCHTGGLSTSDSTNVVLWEQDLFGLTGIGAFSCSSGGLLGIGGPWYSTGTTHTSPGGNAFYAATEGDVQMNQGVLACVPTNFSQGDLNSAVTHELGHTLGFRHADQTRPNNPSIACENDATLECAGSALHTTPAIMRSFINGGLSGALQSWDQHAVTAVYPALAINPPTSVVATGTGSGTIGLTWVAASGAASYRVYRYSGGVWSLITSGGCASPTATSCSDSVSAGTAYMYKVHSFNGSESGDSNIDFAIGMTFTDPTLTAGSTVIKAVHLTELQNATNALQVLAGQSATTFTDDPPTQFVTTIKAVNVTQLRTAINNARTGLPGAGIATYTFTNSLTAGVSTVTALDFSELRLALK